MMQSLMMKRGLLALEFDSYGCLLLILLCSVYAVAQHVEEWLKIESSGFYPNNHVGEDLLKYTKSILNSASQRLSSRMNNKLFPRVKRGAS